LPVYIEKPVGIDLPAARRIAAAVSAAGVRACVAHYRRRLPAFVAVKQWLAEERIGRVQQVDLRLWKATPKENAGWRLDPAVSGGGHFHDLAPHQLDILLYYFGQPLKVSGISVGADARIADQVSGQILFPDAVLFNGSWNFTAPADREEDNCTITGEKGTIRFHFFRDFHLATMETAAGTESFRFDTPANVQAPLIAEVVQYFRGQGTNPSPVEDAVTGMQMMEQLLGK
jgi:predicted dehydrogenase